MSGRGVDAVDRVGSVNAYVVLSDDQAEQLLRTVLRVLAPGLCSIQEWDGPTPDLHTAGRQSIDVDVLIEHVTKGTHLRFVRPVGGGGPQVYDSSRYDLQKCYAETLVPAGFVGHLAGRKDRLPASLATVGLYFDGILNERVALIGPHLTAEVQKGKSYRTDAAHRLRVLRHRRERRALRLLVRRLQRKGWRVYVAGDTNFDGMPLAPLVSCWVNHQHAEAAGTLGARTPDIVYGPEKAADVETLPTRSDHDAVVAVYPRRAA